MATQFSFFQNPNGLQGFQYRPALVDATLEAALVARVRELPFQEFDFHGYKGKRRVVSFGWKYEFSGGGQLREAGEIPEFLLPLRSLVASFARVEPDAFQHVLVTEYGCFASKVRFRDWTQSVQGAIATWSTKRVSNP